MGKEILYNTNTEKMTGYSLLLRRVLLAQQVTVYSPFHHCKCQQTANVVKNWVCYGDCGNIYI